MTDHPPSSAEMSAEIKRLSEALDTLSNHRFVRIHNSIWKMMGLQLLRGLALGLGTVIGASALVSAVVVLLSQVEVIPVIGSFATQIIEEIQQDTE